MSAFDKSTIAVSIYIGVLAKTLVKKGVLTKEELISELDAVKARIEENPKSAEILLDIDGMISTIRLW